MHVQLGRSMDNKIQKRTNKQKPTTTSEELRAKTGCQEPKQGAVHAPRTQQQQRGWQTT